MVKSITLENLKRMFPFEFFMELAPNLPEYVFMNPGLIMHKDLKINISEKERRQLFEAARISTHMQALQKNNIQPAEPLGDVLYLELVATSDEFIESRQKTDVEKSQAPMSILIAQLYDSADLPVFSDDVSESTIQKIPEILYDDPNLMLGVLTFAEDGPKLGILKIPERIEKKLIEPVENKD